MLVFYKSLLFSIWFRPKTAVENGADKPVLAGCKPMPLLKAVMVEPALNSTPGQLAKAEKAIAESAKSSIWDVVAKQPWLGD
ncbi:hypothetical protein [Marinobacter salarius]|uniref:hypothetical protein n=1 Tax=Marinobacter salarius TaxID=1420917 RepID=UPI0032ED6523